VKALIHCINRSVLRLSTDEASFIQRGFRGNNACARERIETIGSSFIVGYNMALTEEHPGSLPSRLRAIPLEDLGFAYEGAAMAFALLDCLGGCPRIRLFLP